MSIHHNVSQKLPKDTPQHAIPFPIVVMEVMKIVQLDAVSSMIYSYYYHLLTCFKWAFPEKKNVEDIDYFLS